MSIMTCFTKIRIGRAGSTASITRIGLMSIGLLLFFSIQFFPGPVAAQGAGTEEQASSAELLSPGMQGALNYVLDRYSVTHEEMAPVFEAVQKFGQVRGLDPLLILAVIAVESSFDPVARSHKGALGLMQVLPRFHMDKLPEGKGKKAFLDPVINIEVGTRILDEYISRRGNLIAGLQSYNGASDNSNRYARKVLAEKARLESAARQHAQTRSEKVGQEA